MADNLESIDISQDIDTYKYTPDDNVKKLINDAKFDYDRDFNENSTTNIGKKPKEMKDNAIETATKAWKEWKGKNNKKISFYELYTNTVGEEIKKMTGENDAEKINNLREKFSPAFRVIQLEKFLIKNITVSYDDLKLLIQNKIAKEQQKTRKKAWDESNEDFHNYFVDTNSSVVNDLTQNTMRALSQENLNSLKQNYENEVKELAEKKKKEQEYELLMQKIEEENAKKQGEFVSSTFTKEEKELMKKIEEDRKKQEAENAESLAKFSHQEQPARSVKLENHSPTSSIETKSGAYEDIEDGEEDELDKKNNEIIKYKHIKNTKNNTGETIPYKAITNAFERRFQTMPITEINRIMEQEINNDVDIFDITKNDGIFEYQYMKTKHFECINIINVIDVNTYGKNLLDKIKGERKDIDEIMTEFTNKINNKINKKLKVPKARIYLRYINEDMGINVPYDDDRSDDFKWRAYSINPLNETTRNLNYTEHPLFYVKMKKDKPNEYIFDKDNSEVVSEKKYMEKLTSELSDSKDQSLTTFLGGLGMGIVLDSWDWFCKGLDKDSCELYSFCMLNKNNNKCELGQIANSTNQPYQGFNDDKLNIPNSQMLNTAWEEFKKCNTSITSDDEKGKIKCKIEDIFNFYEDENFNYDNYEILKGIIEEYKTKIKYISLNGYIKNYLEKIKNHISEENVNKEVIKILTNIDEIIKKNEAFEENFEKEILNDFGDAVNKLFDDETVLIDFKNIFKLCNDKYLEKGKKISDNLEDLILNMIKDKLSDKGGFYRKYADQITAIKTQLQNNKNLHNYLDDSKLKIVEKMMKTIENQTLSSSDIYKNMDEVMSKLETISKKINSDHMKRYNEFISQYIVQVKEEIKRIDRRLGFLNSISIINRHSDGWYYIPENEITEKKEEAKKESNKAKNQIESLKRKIIKGNLIDEKIKKEKKEEKEREKEEFEEKQRKKEYNSIEKFKESIRDSKATKKKINEKTREFITNILNSIDKPTIEITKDGKYKFQKNVETNYDDVLKNSIAKQDAIKISTKYEKAFIEEMDDLNDYVVLDEMTETTYKKEEGKIKKALLNLNTKKNNPHREAYKKDVKDIDDLLKVFQNKISNVKEESVKTELVEIHKKLEEKLEKKKKQMFSVIVPSSSVPQLTNNTIKRKITVEQIKKQNKDVDAHLKRLDDHQNKVDALLKSSANGAKKKKKKKSKKK